MGTWGVDSLENDGACDYASEVASSTDFVRLEATFDRLLKQGTDYVQAPDAEEAIAAADIIARLRGRFGKRDAYTESIDKWVEQMQRRKHSPSEALVDQAPRTVARIPSEPSELLELWTDSEELPVWKEAVEALLKRLQ